MALAKDNPVGVVGFADDGLAHLYRTRMPHPVARAYHRWENSHPGTIDEVWKALGFYESLLWTAALVRLAEHLATQLDDSARASELEREDKLGLWLRQPTLATMRAILGYCAARARKQSPRDELDAGAFDPFQDSTSTVDAEAESLRTMRNSLYHANCRELHPGQVLPRMREDLGRVGAAFRWLGEERVLGRLRVESGRCTLAPFVGVGSVSAPIGIDSTEIIGDVADACVAIDSKGNVTSLSPLLTAVESRWGLAHKMAAAGRWPVLAANRRTALRVG